MLPIVFGCALIAMFLSYNGHFRFFRGVLIYGWWGYSCGDLFA